ncbi:hypothetical protein SDRG_06798 [Saprolegnia diclina VS20]|uniref:SPX domain-containing protein n=1 Tax=Saprolegnia diclina (strain VS20) TaxID=1156394 RepID=T0RUF1_SAPDV|nr:hypothetical protein SDRG_06798 [Saprolegnia diclina VS20]EQC36063.1 hypothetical protein SDRG_06798 [Saprolegnia diclina VS20]|eukprot:XP_008610825.1 hypothetical protein SDRG_06798 [Saprolegnia diclina VS20]
MLTFQSTLERNAFPVWREHYVSYLELKSLVQKLWRRSTFLRRHQKGDEAAPCLMPQASDFEAVFVANCVRVEDWYSARLGEFSTEFALLAQQWTAPRNDDGATKVLETTCIELHRLVHGLYNYARINYTALRKILKKYLKKCPTASANHDKLQAELHSQAFATAEAAQRLAADLEAFYTASFHDNDRVLALSELDGWKDDALDWRHVYIGLKMGVCSVLTLWVLWHYVVSGVSTRVVLSQTKAYPVYRGVALLLFFHWLWGLTQYVLHSARIDYLYICELDPRTTADYTHVFNDASDLTMPMMLFMEPMRRAMWSCLAIKNEHLRNTLGFQSTYSLPLHLDPPSSLDEDKASATTYLYKIVALSAGLLCLSVAAIVLG